SEFGFADPTDAASAAGANTLQDVIITTLPANGSLTLDTGAGPVAVTAGQAHVSADFSGLVFTPPANANGTGYASFTFQVQDNGGVTNGGVDTDPSPNTITVNVTSVNDAPSGANNTLTLLEDGSHTFTSSKFAFTDPTDTPTPHDAIPI